MFQSTLTQRFPELVESRELYCLATGLTYDEIADKFYHRQKNKFIYRIRKIRKLLGLRNRDQVAFAALYHGLININKLKQKEVLT